MHWIAGSQCGFRAAFPITLLSPESTRPLPQDWIFLDLFEEIGAAVPGGWTVQGKRLTWMEPW